MVQIVQTKVAKGERPETYPWPVPSATLQGAKGQIQRWLAKVAQHHQMEVAPKFEWHGKRSNELTLSPGKEHEVKYRFELVEER